MIKSRSIDSNSIWAVQPKLKLSRTPKWYLIMECKWLLPCSTVTKKELKIKWHLPRHLTETTSCCNMLIKFLETHKLGLAIMATKMSHPDTSVQVKNFVEIKHNKRSAPSQPSQPASLASQPSQPASPAMASQPGNGKPARKPAHRLARQPARKPARQASPASAKTVKTVESTFIPYNDSIKYPTKLNLSRSLKWYLIIVMIPYNSVQMIISRSIDSIPFGLSSQVKLKLLTQMIPYNSVQMIKSRSINSLIICTLL